ncbi:MAG: hypothetical protein QXN93_01395 [Methanomassiliicoccales archaeon]
MKRAISTVIVRFTRLDLESENGFAGADYFDKMDINEPVFCHTIIFPDRPDLGSF